MKNLKVIKVEREVLFFDDGTTLKSHHDQDCCEKHYLDFEHLDLSDFDGLLFDLSSDDFFKRIEGYGIELCPVNNAPSIRIPGYGDNNGYYGSDIRLVVNYGDGKAYRSYDVSECQNYTYG